MLKFSNISIRNRALLLGLGPAFLMFVLLVSLFVWQRVADAKSDIEIVGNILSSQLAASVEYPVISGNFNLLEPLVENAISSPSVIRVSITSEDNTVIYQRQTDGYKDVAPSNAKLYRTEVSREQQDYSGFSEFDEVNTIKSNRVVIAYVNVEMSMLAGYERAILIGSKSLFWASFVLFLCFLLARKMSNTLATPIEAVSGLLARVAKGELNIQAEVTDKTEIGLLQKSVNSMTRALRDSEKLKNISISDAKNALLAVEKANVVKSNFLSIVSHELRTPINGAMGSLQLMDRCEESELKEYVSIAESSLNNLLELVEDILTLAQTEQGDQELLTESVYVPGSLKNALAELELLAEANNNELHISYDNNLLNYYIEIDGSKFRQVVRHIVDNAIKFTHGGRIYCSMYLENVNDGLHLKLDISDSGIGFPKEHKNSLFLAFKQEDSALDRQFEGLGIGLTICQNNIELMSGKINIRDNIEAGTVVNCSLPVLLLEPVEKPGSSDIDNALEDHIEGLENDTSKGSILVVEDNQVNRMIVEKILSKLNYSVTAVESGQACLDSVKVSQYQLIFMDCQMPGMDGFKTTASLRKGELSRGLKSTPIVALTANTSANIRQKCLAAGMSDYMPKPVNIEKLKKVIEHWI
jgi:signal transduction histidine kinase/ActR/RegA family two-component response regulator